MTKTDFAELKEKLTKFDADKFLSVKIYSVGDVSIDAARSQHTLDSAIISELIEIIKLQGDAANEIKYQCGRTYNTTDADEVSKLEHVFPLSLVLRTLSETTTRLQKLRDGK